MSRHNLLGAGSGDAVLEQRVKNVEDDIGDIKSSLQQIMSALSGFGRTNWPTIIAAGVLLLGVITYVGNLTLEPIKQNNAYLMQNVVPRTEHLEKWHANDRQFDDMEMRITEARAAGKVDMEHVQSQLDDVKRSIGGIYGAHDVVQELQQRLQRLEDREDRSGRFALPPQRDRP